MKPYWSLFIIVLAALAAVMTGFSACSSSPPGEGVGIYLTRDDVPPAEMPALSHVALADRPLISMNDIVSYNSQTFELKLTAEAFKRIVDLEVPVRGKTFMVCVDKAPLYFGAFWTPVSSMSFSGVTIWKPLSHSGPYVLQLSLGYPDASFYGGEAPRNNSQFTGALERAGKLITRLTINDIEKLPASSKGYELYSWQKDGQWHFTLITGTNRNKTVEEVVSGTEYISETDFLNIHVTGSDALLAVLSKVPQNETVSWVNWGLTGEATAGVTFSLPDPSVIEQCKARAAAAGFALMVPPQ